MTTAYKREAPKKRPRLSSRVAAPLLEWFAVRGWKPAGFQREVWARYLAGESGLLHTPTGSGKTLAAIGGPLIEALSTPEGTVSQLQHPATGRLKVLWVTPLRALASDTTRALQQTVDELGLPWSVVRRTGDATAKDKRMALRGQADVLVITPESLALLLTYAETALQFAKLKCIVVDEWHELLGNKRGVLLQLCLARLRRLSPGVRIWGLSATLGNLPEARDVLLPNNKHAALVGGVRPRAVEVESIIPDEKRRLPWAGHLGLNQLFDVYEKLLTVRTTLLFTNTRAQAELWHRALESIWLDGPDSLALHHGSLDAKLRKYAEDGLRDGTLRCVVATSSLDLGVDFPSVDQVIQIGSPKGIARLSQRAGRARHRPGESGKVICVPTQALDLLEYAAAREALKHGRIEARQSPRLSLDVLAQHCITIALGGGFKSAELLEEVRETYSFRDLSDRSWSAVLDFIVHGGRSLENYPEYSKVIRDEDGVYRVTDRRIALRHRLSVGTIISDGSLRVKMLRGGTLGSIEESFIGRMRRGDKFLFAGRTLELVRLEEMTVYVRRAKSSRAATPTWQGSRMSLSNELGHEVEKLISLFPSKSPRNAELRELTPLLNLQKERSALPASDILLVELINTRRGQHLFLYPFAGRSVHEGLAALMAMRWGRIKPNTFSYAVNDYGLMITVEEPAEVNVQLLGKLLTPEGLTDDLLHSLNMGELARRQFREIARVAGLLPPSLPGRAPRSTRQLQASSGLLYDVLKRYDLTHILLLQAEREVLEQQLEVTRLQSTLEDCTRRMLKLLTPRWLTPFSFSIWAESFRGQLSNEDWSTRVRRAADRLERRYDKERLKTI